MKQLFTILALLVTLAAGAQSNINADCVNAIPLCSTPSFTFNANSGVGTYTDIPNNSNISNPTTNPASTNAGCLLSGELNPQWLLITIGNAGFLEFVFGAGNSPNPQAGFYDWAMWPYTPATCAGIQNNTLPPVRCNWNGSSTGGTGIASSTNIPTGGSPSNYEPPLAVQPCQQYIICISNYSGVNTLVSFQSIGTASLSCDPNCLSVTNPVVCAGQNATIIAASSGTITNMTYSLNPGGVTSSTPTFVISQPVGGSYTVYATGLNSQSVAVTQTAVSTVTVKSQPVAAPTLTNSTCTSTFNAFNLNLGFVPSNPVPSYTVIWSTIPTGVSSPTQTAGSGGLLPGLYTATVLTPGSCSTVANFSIDPQPAPASVSLTPAGPVYSITCYDPTITVNAMNTSFNYTWTNGMIAPKTGATADFNYTGAGTWTITAENPASGCIATKTIVVGINTVTPLSSVSPTFQSINCNLSSITNVTASATNPTVNITHRVLSPYGGTFAVNTATMAYPPGGVGEYTHFLVNDVNGCSSTKIFTVTSSMGFPVFTVVSPQNFTLGCGTKSTAVITIANGNTTPPGGAVSYTLLSPGASSATPAGTLSSVNTYSVFTPGTWTVITKDNSSLCETRVPVTVISNTFAPGIDSVIVPTQVLTCDQPVETLRGISFTQNVSYNWSFPGIPGNQAGDTLTVAAKLNAPTNTIVASYTLTITDNNNTCRSFTVVPIYQNVFPPKPVITNGGTSSLTCNTHTIMLSNSSSSGIQGIFPKNLPVVGYIWEGPSPQLKLNVSSTYLAQTPGTYTLTVKDLNNGCTSSTTLPIYDYREYPVVNNPVIPPPSVLDCGAQSASLVPVISSPTANLSYSWTAAPGATVSGRETRTLTTNMAGDYRLLVTNTVNGCATSVNMKVVTGSLIAVATADKHEGFAPLTVTLYNNSTSSAGSASITSAWNFGNGTHSVTSQAGNVDVRYDAPGTYTVTLFSSKGACLDSATLVIHVDIPSRLEIPNIFTPNGDGVNDRFFLKTANLSEISISITDRWGHLVYEVVSDKGNIEWDGKNQFGKLLPEGTYFYVLKASGKDGASYDQNGTVTLAR